MRDPVRAVYVTHFGAHCSGAVLQYGGDKGRSGGKGRSGLRGCGDMRRRRAEEARAHGEARGCAESRAEGTPRPKHCAGSGKGKHGRRHVTSNGGGREGPQAVTGAKSLQYLGAESDACEKEQALGQSPEGRNSLQGWEQPQAAPPLSLARRKRKASSSKGLIKPDTGFEAHGRGTPTHNKKEEENAESHKSLEVAGLTKSQKKGEGNSSHRKGEAKCSHRKGEVKCSHRKGEVKCTHRKGEAKCSHRKGEVKCSQRKVEAVARLHWKGQGTGSPVSHRKEYVDGFDERRQDAPSHEKGQATRVYEPHKKGENDSSQKNGEVVRILESHRKEATPVPHKGGVAAGVTGSPRKGVAGGILVYHRKKNSQTVSDQEAYSMLKVATLQDACVVPEDYLSTPLLFQDEDMGNESVKKAKEHRKPRRKENCDINIATQVTQRSITKSGIATQETQRSKTKLGLVRTAVRFDGTETDVADIFGFPNYLRDGAMITRRKKKAACCRQVLKIISKMLQENETLRRRLVVLSQNESVFGWV